MRTILQAKFLVFFAGVFLLASCGKSKSDLLVKKWKATELDLSGAKLTGDQVNIVYDFAKDGNFSRTEGEKTEQGTWKLNEDGNKLTLDIKGNNAKVEKTVEQLTPEKLVISGEEYSMRSTLTFVPAESK